MPDPVITLPSILSLAPAVVDTTPSLQRDPILLLPDARSMAPISAVLPSQPRFGSGYVPSATVEVVDTAPIISSVNSGIVPPSRLSLLPPPFGPSAAPWWKDPMKLGLLAAGLVVVALFMTKE
ncbi:MAG TPA: hypothetical protein VFF77_03495 [Holophagaceae bacterium]|nr:hypothetical protein [Holophagaceae bacterium]